MHPGPAGPEYLDILGQQFCFRIASFDERAAVEAAIRTFQPRQRGQVIPTALKFDLCPFAECD